MCLRQYIVGSFVGKFCSSAVLGLLFLVATFTVNVPAASAHMHTICSGIDPTYTVVGGDTLSEIGYRYDISWLTLASYNRIANPNLIYAGQTACIPLHRVVSKASAQAQNSIVLVGSGSLLFTPGGHKSSASATRIFKFAIFRSAPAKASRKFHAAQAISAQAKHH